MWLGAQLSQFLYVDVHMVGVQTTEMQAECGDMSGPQGLRESLRVAMSYVCQQCKEPLQVMSSPTKTPTSLTAWISARRVSHRPVSIPV